MGASWLASWPSWFKPLVQLAQPRLHELLALERGLVFGVLPQVAQLHRLGDGLGKKDVEFVAELIDLTAQLFPHLTDHDETRIRKKSLAMGVARLSRASSVKDTPGRVRKGPA